MPATGAVPVTCCQGHGYEGSASACGSASNVHLRFAALITSSATGIEDPRETFGTVVSESAHDVARMLVVSKMIPLLAAEARQDGTVRVKQSPTAIAGYFTPGQGPGPSQTRPISLGRGRLLTATQKGSARPSPVHRADAVICPSPSGCG